MISAATEGNQIIKPLKPPAVKLDEENECSINVSSESSGDCVIKNGKYFLNVLNSEINIMEGLVNTASQELNQLDSSCEESGRIRTAIGKANLLINSKLKQFRELCEKNIDEEKRGVTEIEPYTTKNDDLAGFWDMCLIQVFEIYEMFGVMHAPSEVITETGPKKRPSSTKKITPRFKTPASSAAAKSKTQASSAR